MFLAVGSAPASAAAPDRFLPADTEIVLSINVKGLLDSPLVKKYALDELKAALQSHELLTRLNTDPLKIVEQITIAGGNIKFDAPAGGKPIPQAKAETLIIIRGRFDPDRANRLLAETAQKSPDKVGVTEHGTLKVYELKGLDAPLFGVFVDKETLLLSETKSRVTNVLDQGQGQRPDKVSKQLAAILEKVDDKPTVWVASTIPAAMKDLLKTATLAGGGDVADKLVGVTIGLAVKDNIGLEFNIHATDTKAATQVRFGLEKAKALATVLVLTVKDKDPDAANALADILSSIRITVRDNAASIRGEVTAETIDKALKGSKNEKP
jgi:hypothetical protein